MSEQERAEAVEWLENDASYLRAAADKYAAGGNDWLAEKVRKNAEHSEQLAEQYKSEANQ